MESLRLFLIFALLCGIASATYGSSRTSTTSVRPAAPATTGACSYTYTSQIKDRSGDVLGTSRIVVVPAGPGTASATVSVTLTDGNAFDDASDGYTFWLSYRRPNTGFHRGELPFKFATDDGQTSLTATVSIAIPTAGPASGPIYFLQLLDMQDGSTGCTRGGATYGCQATPGYCITESLNYNCPTTPGTPPPATTGFATTSVRTVSTTAAAAPSTTGVRPVVPSGCATTYNSQIKDRDGNVVGSAIISLRPAGSGYATATVNVTLLGSNKFACSDVGFRFYLSFNRPRDGFSGRDMPFQFATSNGQKSLVVTVTIAVPGGSAASGPVYFLNRVALQDGDTGCTRGVATGGGCRSSVSYCITEQFTNNCLDPVATTAASRATTAARLTTASPVTTASPPVCTPDVRVSELREGNSNGGQGELVGTVTLKLTKTGSAVFPEVTITVTGGNKFLTANEGIKVWASYTAPSDGFNGGSMQKFAGAKTSSTIVIRPASFAYTAGCRTVHFMVHVSMYGGGTACSRGGNIGATPPFCSTFAYEFCGRCAGTSGTTGTTSTGTTSTGTTSTGTTSTGTTSTGTTSTGTTGTTSTGTTSTGTTGTTSTGTTSTGTTSTGTTSTGTTGTTSTGTTSTGTTGTTSTGTTSTGTTGTTSTGTTSTGTTGTTSTGTTSTGTTGTTSTGTTSTGTTGTTSTGTTSTGTTSTGTTSTGSTGSTGTTGIQLGCFNLFKTYDRNVNGVADPDEAEVSGWQFTLTNVDTNNVETVTSPQRLRQLPVGNYRLCDTIPPFTFNWYSTSGTVCRTFTVNAGECTTEQFTCLCTGGGSAKKAGNFWMVSSGQAVINAGDLQALRDLNLKDETGADFQPTTAASLVSWHNNAVNPANAGKAAWYLSAQLAVATLNLRHYVDPTVHVKAFNLAPYIPSPSGFVQLARVVATADVLLSNSSANFVELTAFGSALYDYNRNENYAQSGPCGFSFPAPGNLDANSGSAPAQLIDASAAGSASMSGYAVYAIVGAVGAALVVAGVVVVVRKRAGRRSSLVAPWPEHLGKPDEIDDLPGLRRGSVDPPLPPVPSAARLSISS